MQTTYRRLPDYNSTVKIEAAQEKVIVKYKNLFSDYVTEYAYKDLAKRIARGRVSDTSWSSIGFFFLFLPIILNVFVLGVLFPGYSRAPVALAIYGLSFIIALISFAMLAQKENWVYFHKKDDSVAFAIKITSNNRDQANAVAEYIKNQIEKIEVS